MMRQTWLSVALALILPASLVSATEQPRCYLPNGSLDPSSYACNATAAMTGGASACCLGNDLCYKTGTCFQGWSGVTYRQSCTDQSWKDPACPQYCLEPAFQSLGVWITQCDVPNGQACCLNEPSCCNDTTKWFSWKPGAVTALLNASGTDWLPPEYLSLPGPLPRALVNDTSNITASTNTSTTIPTTVPGSTNATCPAVGTAPAGSDGSTAVATIAVGVVLGLLLFLALIGIVILWRLAVAERASRLEIEVALRQLQLAQQQGAVYGALAAAHYEKPAPWIPVHEIGVPSPRHELYDTAKRELSTSGSEVTGQSRAPSSLTATQGVLLEVRLPIWHSYRSHAPD